MQVHQNGVLFVTWNQRFVAVSSSGNITVRFYRLAKRERTQRYLPGVFAA